MKNYYFTTVIFLALFISTDTFSQKRGLKQIDVANLKMHMDFLASDELGGRASGEQGLQTAAKYIAVQAERAGLRQSSEANGYMQYYTLYERAYDWDNSSITIVGKKGDVRSSDKKFFLFPALKNDQLLIEGPVVFAGYGINEPEYNYDDFENIDIEGKIVVIMDRAPMNEDGSESKFGEKWNNAQNFQFKMQNIFSKQPKAVFLVFDPKSGIKSIEDMNPSIARYLSKSIAMEKPDEGEIGEIPGPKMVLIHREIADQLLSSHGKTLDEIQAETDRTLESPSFNLEGTKVKLQLRMKNRELSVPNVFGYIEGSDPDLKDEMVIYMAHFDHLGIDGAGGVYNGADDNASGSVGLIEVANAFQAEKKNPRRSVGFLWVSGEEIGLFGSKHFSEDPLIPLEQISAAINLDMIGRTVTAEDVEKGREGMTIVGNDSVKVIGGKQSKVLMDISNEAFDEAGLFPNFSYNDENHPQRFFYRSDHINLARKDIPVLFYSTGTHSDYHEITDDPSKIDYNKFLRMTKFCYLVGYKVANFKDEIVVDNPMSGW